MPPKRPARDIEAVLVHRDGLDVDGTNPLPTELPGNDATNPLAVDVVPDGEALADGSGTITTGGTSQTVFAANASRSFLLIQNVSAEPLWVNFGAAANEDQPSVKLPIDEKLMFDGRFVPTESVDIVGATTGSSFTAKQA